MMRITWFAVTGLAVLLCAGCNQIPVLGRQDAVESGDKKKIILVGENTASNTGEGGNAGSGQYSAPINEGFDGESGDFTAQLDEIAELERSGGFAPGLGLAESGFRERSGDYAGAVLAVYKELSWAYSRGEGNLTREKILQSLNKVQTLDTGAGAKEAALAARAFFEERWDEAETLIRETFGERGPDSYSNWMLLVCALEGGGASREVQDAYAAIRARYVVFPEYWYRGARGLPGEAARVYAERCVNLAAAGPYAGECRRILAEAAGLEAKDGAALKTRAEAEGIAVAALEANRPELLAELLPLLALPDNPYTLYVSGALRALASAEPFRLWFSGEAAKAKGRLAERLLYIVRG